MQITRSRLLEAKEANLNLVPSEAGVYRLSYKNTTKNEIYVFYVGQSDDLNKRLKEHFSGIGDNKCINGHVKNDTCYFRYAKVGKQSDRDGIEAFLYKHYGKNCNIQEPKSVPIPVNLD